LDLVGKLGNGVTSQAAARVLAKRGGGEVVEALSAALTHENWQVRAGAAFALGQMGQAAQPAKAALEKSAAADAEQAVRDAAAFALDAIAEDGR
jgi:HEAT repeat protein